MEFKKIYLYIFFWFLKVIYWDVVRLFCLREESLFLRVLVIFWIGRVELVGLIYSDGMKENIRRCRISIDEELL